MYNKIFNKILDSSIWLEPTPTRIVWITLLAAMDQDGFAHFSALENLAARARVTTDEAQAAVDCFLSPDENSANPANEGRRIERVPGGYMILNASVHRQTVNRIIQREQTRERVARHRAKDKKRYTTVTPTLQTVTTRPEAEAEAETDKTNTMSGDARPPAPKLQKDVNDVIDFLNQRTGKAYRSQNPDGSKTATNRAVLGILKKGYTVQDCKTMIARKVREWSSDPKMVNYLRPKTLFAVSNFENYHGQCVEVKA